MPVTKLRITRVGHLFGFAETVDGKKKPVFVSYGKKRLVENAGTSHARFVWGKCPIPYFLSVGDIIVAEIRDGNKKRKAAINWAPESVWNGVNGNNPASKTSNKVFNFISKSDMPKLNPETDGSVAIRVLNSDRKQLDRGYGKLETMLGRTNEDIVAFSKVGIIVEAQIKKCWIQIQNPFVKITVAKMAA
jgi:hypothetical protein